MKNLLLVLSVLVLGCTPQKRACLPTYFNCMDECGNTRECEQNCASIYTECVNQEFNIPIHYVVVTSNAANLNESDFRAEVDTLNKYFQAFDTRFPTNKRKVVNFEYKSTTFLSNIQGLNNPLIDFLQSQTDHIGRADEFQGLFNNESNQAIRDSTAINIYIYDNFSDSIRNSTGLPWGLSSQNSHGRWNTNNPYNWIDYYRLGHRQAVEEHEMGHCFMLGHICNSGALESTPTNIMSSGINCNGSGGDRSIALNEDQVQQVLSLVPDIISELNN